MSCRKVFACIAVFCSVFFNALAQDSEGRSYVSPYYFGPNAFPVPDMMDRTSDKLRLEIAGDYYAGDRGDRTYDMCLKMNVPLWTRRANLSLWMPVHEWWRNSEANIEVCGIAPELHEKAMRGEGAGDVYVGIDLQLLEERRVRPDWTLRSVLKTASGGDCPLARYYDSAGYFFDSALGKTFGCRAIPQLSFRLAVSGGFLCWQTGEAEQNDAIMYGAKLVAGYDKVSLTAEYGGYSGWQHAPQHLGYLVYDQPQTLKFELAWKIKSCVVSLAYRHGIADYPYDQYRVGLAYCFDILKKH